MSRTAIIVLSVWAFGLGAKSAQADVEATFVLGIPTINGTVANYPLTLEYATDTLDEVVFFSLDVSASDPQLTTGGTNYTRFQFMPASPLLDAWSPLVGTGFGVGSSTVEWDTFTAPLSTGVHRLGLLQADFTGTLLAPGAVGALSLRAVDSTIGVELSDQIGTFRFVEVKHRTEIIPEPYGLFSWVTGLLGLMAHLRRR